MGTTRPRVYDRNEAERDVDVDTLEGRRTMTPQRRASVVPETAPLDTGRLRNYNDGSRPVL